MNLTLALHGISAEVNGGGVSVSMAQAARPVIPLLLDSRGSRNMTSGTPVYD